MVSLYQNDDEFDECNFPSVLVWYPINAEQTVYGLRDTYTLRVNDVNRMGNYHIANISFN